MSAKRPEDDAPLDDRAEWWFQELRRRASMHHMPHLFKERMLPIEMVAGRLPSPVSRLLWELLLERKNRGAPKP
jgi:hypothetical protein